MSRINDGGYAYPQTPAVGPSGDIYHPQDGYGGGMTMRDWFAGQALTGLLAGDPRYEGEDASQAAADAYQYADAMIAEREKGGAA